MSIRIQSTSEQFGLFLNVFLPLTLPEIAARVQETNSYGGNTPIGTRILYVNGDVDPWSGLSVLQSLNPLPVLDHGASHHAWTHLVSLGCKRVKWREIKLQCTFHNGYWNKLYINYCTKWS